MKFFMASLLTIGLLITPAAASVKLETVPENVLMDGLNTLTVCITTEMVAIAAINNYIAEAKEDKELSTKLEAVVSDLLDHATTENELGMMLMETLVKRYKKSYRELGQAIQELSNTTGEELKKQINDDNVKDFLLHFKSHIDACTNTTKSWLNKIQTYDKDEPKL